jgi:hypothetical protein
LSELHPKNPLLGISIDDRPTIPLTLSLSPQGRGDACTDPASRMYQRATGCAPSPIEETPARIFVHLFVTEQQTAPPLPSRGEECCRMLCSHPHSQAATDKFVFFTYDAANRSHHSALNVRCSMFDVYRSLFTVSCISKLLIFQVYHGNQDVGSKRQTGYSGSTVAINAVMSTCTSKWPSGI